MSTLPLVPPKFRAFNANGDPLSGGKLFAYAAGTTTPLDTYTTRAGNVANANPVVLDANGEADVWTAQGVLYKFVLKDASNVTQWTVDNVPSGADTSSSADSAIAIDPGGRLTLSSGTPVTTSDVTNASTIFYTAYKHDKVPLYDGGAWALHTLASELSQALSDSTKSPAAAIAMNLYDLFIWNDAGTLRLSRGPLWASAAARGTGAGTTELERVGGRYVNKQAISNGPAAQRGLYVGTINTNGSGVAVNDTFNNRHCWNAYHRVERPLLVTEVSGTATWTYSAAAWRAANGNAANSLGVVIGLPEEPIWAEVAGSVISDGSDVVSSTLGAGVGIGIDSTSVNSATLFAFPALADFTFENALGVASGIALRSETRASYNGFPGIGFHFLAWLEYGEGFNVQTWSGTVDTATMKLTSGMRGTVFA